MNKTILSLIVLLFSAVIGSAQNPDDKVQNLMQQRSRLFNTWKQYNLEENAFFGGKSKKDLRKIIETQKNIVNLDNQIFGALRLAGLEDEQPSKNKRRSLSRSLDSLYSLKVRAEKKTTAAEKREQILQETLNKQRSYVRKVSTALVVSLLLLAVSVFYILSKRKK